ncbi:hypothetical protein [Streptomyces sp. NPDC059009]|uniref:hypothetical protein n=1 Tax=Streptomyces sp. NPDC059009 TaxID=3346694 RepID=UPI0036A0AF2A
MSAMTCPATDIAAEYHRANQLGAARAVETLLKRDDIPPVTTWEIDSAGAVRGHLMLSAWSKKSAIDAVREVHRVHGGKVRTRHRADGAHEIAARFNCALRRVELWALTQQPDTLALQRENRQLLAQAARTDEYLARLGWFNDDERTMRRHTASGWWELAIGYGDANEWLLFGPDGSPFGALMSGHGKKRARANADTYIAERESQ